MSDTGAGRLPAKVFNISPHRSGTRSFHAWCCAHGIWAQHWCGPSAEDLADSRLGHARNCPSPWRLWSAFREYYAEGDVFSDLPTPLTYQAALTEAPGAKFVLILRDPQEWVRSVRHHKGQAPFTAMERLFYGQITETWPGDSSGVHDYSDTALADGYRGYVREATVAVRRAGASLFVGGLGDPALGPMLAEFMGFQQVHAFGHVHDHDTGAGK